jgi:site-specific DNA-methyltransferase (adenine-specific)
MNPTWESDCGRVRLYRGDCRDVVGNVKCDSIVCDPPYGIAHPCDFKKRGRGNLAACNDWSDVEGDAEPFDPAWILAMNKPSVLWGGNWFANKLPPSGGWLVWDKKRPDDLDQSTCELAWTNCVKGVRRFEHLWNGMMKASERGENYHPTQKPVALMEWTLSLPWLLNSKTIFDPYMGSAPVGLACLRTGRAYIGVERMQQHFDTAKARIIRELAQPFIPGMEPSRQEQGGLF